MTIVWFLAGGYLGGLLCVLLSLKDDNDLNVSSIGASLLWPVSAAFAVTDIVKPAVAKPIGVVKAVVSGVVALVNKVRGK